MSPCTVTGGTRKRQVHFAEDGPRTTSQPSSSSSGSTFQPRALILDEELHSTSILIEQGYIPVRYSHWGILTGQTNTIAARLKAQEYRIVWAAFPYVANKDRGYQIITAVLNWARLCKELGTPFILFGPFGKKWKDPQVTDFVSRQILILRYHRLCHFGMKADNSSIKPSSACWVTASTVDIEPHPCQCPLPQTDHHMDLKVDGHGSTKRMQEVQSQLLHTLLPLILERLGCSASVYPTQDLTLKVNSHNDDKDQQAKSSRKKRKAERQQAYFGSAIPAFFF